MEEKKDNPEVIAAEGTAKTPNAEVEKKVVAAPEGGEPAPAVAETAEIEEEDVDQLISLLNEIDMAFDGKGGIETIPEELKGVVKTMIDQMTGVREVIEDPEFKAILDDLMDQRADGKTPSLRVAIARTMPYEEIIKLAEGGEEGPVQEAVAERALAEKVKMEGEQALEANIEGSMAALEAYAESMGYDDAEKAELHSTIKQLMDIFADGKVTEAEFTLIDKMRNYDRDTEELRGQIPAEPTKEVLPDKASMEAAVAPEPVKAAKGPTNSIEAMQAQMPQIDVTDIGKRKRSPGGYGR